MDAVSGKHDANAVKQASPPGTDAGWCMLVTSAIHSMYNQRSCRLRWFGCCTRWLSTQVLCHLLRSMPMRQGSISVFHHASMKFWHMWFKAAIIIGALSQIMFHSNLPRQDGKLNAAGLLAQCEATDGAGGTSSTRGCSAC